MLEAIFSVEGLAALTALTAMEILLGIDNIVFISVLVSRLPPEQVPRARKLGLAMALAMRLALLFALTSMLKLTAPAISPLGYALSWRDIILFVGGAFLVAKGAHEMHLELERGDAPSAEQRKPGSFVSAMMQVAVIDLVFSVDSMITAIGMAREVSIMAAAVILSMVVMYFAAGPVSAFLHRHPTAKMLALAFLVMIGVSLLAESLHSPIDRRVLYGAMAFAVLVEVMNLRASARRRRALLRRRQRRSGEGATLLTTPPAPPSDNARS